MTCKQMARVLSRRAPDYAHDRLVNGGSSLLRALARIGGHNGAIAEFEKLKQQPKKRDEWSEK